MRESKVMNKLRQGGCAICTQVGSAYAPFAGIAAQVGYDCIWLDMEHKALTETAVRESIVATSLYDCDTVVRILKRSYADYFRPLEDGATGVMVPHCKSQQEAEFAVKNTKFFPVGLRGMDFSTFGSDYMMTAAATVVEHSLRNTFTMLQIEDVESLDNLEAICAVPGVDILFIGPADLKQSAQLYGTYTDTFLEDVYEKVACTVSKHDQLYWGTTVGSPELAAHVYDRGARFINVKGDFSAVIQGFSNVYQRTMELLSTERTI